MLRRLALWIAVFSGEASAAVPNVDNLLLENGDNLLLEDGSLLLLESA